MAFEPLLQDFELNPPADEADIRSAESAFGNPIPEDYVSFLRTSDGGQGFVGEHYLILWKASEIVQFNREYEVSQYAPGLVCFGSDGGGEAFAFDTRDTAYPVVMAPFIGLSLNDCIPVADTFSALLKRMATDSDLFETS